jgi:hypothetical protein
VVGLQCLCGRRQHLLGLAASLLPLMIFISFVFVRCGQVFCDVFMFVAVVGIVVVEEVHFADHLLNRVVCFFPTQMFRICRIQSFL